MDHEAVVGMAEAAVPAAWTVFGLLCLAVLGAACDSLPDGTLPGVGMALFSGFHVLLRLFLLVTLLMLAYRLLVTYVHVYRGHQVTRHARLPESTRRRVAGSGRLRQGPGRHRAA